MLCAISNIHNYKNKLANVVIQTNFEALYEAIVRLEVTEQCPAWGTLIKDTSYNPYDHAKEQLETFKHLKEYRKNIENNSQEAIRLYNDLKIKE